MTTLDDTPLRVVNWNVQHANAARARDRVRWLVTIMPDVVVLTEVSAWGSSDLVAQWLGSEGYDVHLPDHGGDRYRVLVACRRGTIEPVDIGMATHPHRCVAARVKMPETHMGVVGIYVPSRGPQAMRNVAKRAFQQAVTERLPTLREQIAVPGPLLVAGDLNVVEPNHVPRYPVFGTWEYDFYEAFRDNGFVDTFRLRHPDAIEHSWLGRPNVTGSRNGYRFDHAFISAEHSDSVVDCGYDHSARAGGLSDHSAMTISLRT